jgi:hypothetical protein
MEFDEVTASPALNDRYVVDRNKNLSTSDDQTAAATSERNAGGGAAAKNQFNA